MASSALTL